MMSDPRIEGLDIVALPQSSVKADIDSVFVALHSEGVTGWYGPVSGVVATYIDSAVRQHIVDRPFMDYRKMLAGLSRSLGSQLAATASWAVGAVDCALWDLRSKLTGIPVARLLSPAPAPDRMVRLYASWLTLDLMDPVSDREIESVGVGEWLFAKWGLRRRQGAQEGYEVARLVEAVHRAAGLLDGPSAFDAVFTWDASMTSRFANVVDRSMILWVEDPLPRSSSLEYRALAEQLPLAVGERVGIDTEVAPILNFSLRAFTIDVVGCGGLSSAVQLTRAAASAGTPVFPHGRSFIPALHLASAFPDAIPAVEYQVQWEPHRQAMYEEPWLPVDACLSVPDSPGLGTAPRGHDVF